jgi:hypothetical protein
MMPMTSIMVIHLPNKSSLEISPEHLRLLLHQDFQLHLVLQL